MKTTERNAFRRRGVVALVLCLALPSCATQSYEADPLDVDGLHALGQERMSVNPMPAEGEEYGPLTLTQAAEWLRTRGPRVREAIADYRAALARAEIETPWPNPTLALGPEFGFGSDVDRNKVVPLGSLGFTIPLNDRLAREDELNVAIADAARFDALGTFRELYLELRASYLRLTISGERQALRTSLRESARSALAVTNDLVRAGQATALDVSLLRLEHARQGVYILTAMDETAESVADLSRLVGVSPRAIARIVPSDLPALPAETPGHEELEAMIVSESPSLFRLRAAYEVAERRLHLEITRQYPDLTLDTAFGGSSGDRKTVLGLSLGIELPVFDQNQQAIAEARARRDALRTRYESRSHDVLTAMEHASGALELAREKHRIYREEILPIARRNVEIANRSLAAGSAGVIQLLDAERSLRQVEVEALDARLGELLAWSELERAVGYPLIQFNSDPQGGARTPPRELSQADAASGGEESR